MIIRRKLTIADKRPKFTNSNKSIIRYANEFDVNDILNLTIELKSKSPFFKISKTNNDLDSLKFYKKLCIEAINDNALVLVSENKTGITGFIFGSIQPTIWSSEYKILEEIGFYAKTKYNAYKLLDEYISIANRLKYENRFKIFTMGSIYGYEVDYGRFNLKQAETKWVG